MTRSRPRVLFVVNVDWFFLSHRLPIARAARDAGAEVVVAAGDTGLGDAIRQEGLEFISLPISRKGTNPARELQTLGALAGLYRRMRPDLVHQVTIKPVLYGSLIARRFPKMAVVNAISGLGYTFSDEQRTGLLRPAVQLLYRAALKRSRSVTIFQNPDDRELFTGSGLVRPDQTVLIRGSGVDVNRFRPVPEPDGPPLVVMPARMLWAKGVKEFVQAANLLRERHPQVRFALVGASDQENPTAVPEDQLRAWHLDGSVEWWGHQADMPAVLAGAAVVALPSYSEGLPKVLLEAAASGRPIVATDVPGCREIVRPDVNGLLVPPRDPAALAEALDALIASRTMRERMGRMGRKIAVSEFSEEIVIRQTMEVYQQLLGDCWPHGVTEARTT